MSSDIHQPPSRRSRASPPCAHAPSFISPSLIRNSLPRTGRQSFLSHSFHPQHFPFFHLFSMRLPIPPTSPLAASRLSPSFWTFSLGPPLNIPPHPNTPPLPTHAPPVMNESVCWLQFIFTEQGSAHCQSPLALHISIPGVKRQRAQGDERRREAAASSSGPGVAAASAAPGSEESTLAARISQRSPLERAEAGRELVPAAAWPSCQRGDTNRE